MSWIPAKSGDRHAFFKLPAKSGDRHAFFKLPKKRFQTTGSVASQSPFFALATVVVLVVAGCSRPDPDPTGRAQALIEESRWDEAADLLKRQLLEQPDDVAAHFYLGRCYLNGSMFYPGAAAGEFETALRLFTETGRHSPISEYNDQYFELRCHLELAKVYLRTYIEYADRGAPRSILQQPMRNLKNAAEAAEKIAPESQDVRDLKSVIESL